MKHFIYHCTKPDYVPFCNISDVFISHPRARNNFRIVSGHDDRTNSFLLGHVSFLAGQMYMMNYSFRGP